MRTGAQSSCWHGGKTARTLISKQGNIMCSKSGVRKRVPGMFAAIMASSCWHCTERFVWGGV